jgi:hypothetical protein
MNHDLEAGCQRTLNSTKRVLVLNGGGGNQGKSDVKFVDTAPPDGRPRRLRMTDGP